MELAVALAVGVVGLGIAAFALGALGRARRESRALGERVVREVEPYLRRKAAEAGIESTPPVWTSRHSASDRVDFSAGLAQELLARERRSTGAGSSAALAETVPASGEANIDTTAPQSPKSRKPE